MRIFIMFMIVLGFVIAQDDYTDKMEKEHRNDKPIAAPIAKKDVKDVTAKDVVYATVAGKEVTGYIAHPKGTTQGLPAVIVIQEWWGLNDNIKTMARKIASQGYVALAVDMYGGNTAETSKQALKLMKKAMGNQQQALDNLNQAHNYLKNNCKATKIGSIGWCFGGHWSLRCGLLFEAKIDAVVIYYGRLVNDKEQLAKLSAPVLGIFGQLDRGIPVESVNTFHEALKSLNKNADINIYPKANHAFANPSGTRYNKEAAENAWEKTMAFFAKHLK
ncbi:dienelactone hydrolase family protein [Candidatus Uabimicrobium amorphum]|uniref:Dienelactone hydrolase n=1 Tax=Uabimicrobium amorphum TaxID=2596890 RepID=A0A5S9IMD5_UABAM|nr:dienelactone hydrolase family protein [Candidatus Uabimicrobium amorphum]BBM84374.1 dienelactone hydrolase [Candidatus Uabimicrobium amorphum]